MVLSGALHGLPLANLHVFSCGDILSHEYVDAYEWGVRADAGLCTDLSRARFQPLDVHRCYPVGVSLNVASRGWADYSIGG